MDENRTRIYSLKELAATLKIPLGLIQKFQLDDDFPQPDLYSENRQFYSKRQAEGVMRFFERSGKASTFAMMKWCSQHSPDRYHYYACIGNEGNGIGDSINRIPFPG